MMVHNSREGQERHAKSSYRQKGGEVRGSLYRGTASHAFTKKSIGSIPSKFETVLYPQSASTKKGFGSNGFRFTVQASENPGPGAYIDPTKNAHSSMRLISDSFSKKGYGNGFVSACERFRIENYYPYQVPGPGAYKPLASIINGRPSKPTSSPNAAPEKYKRKPSSAFMPREGKLRVEKQRYQLGPGSYEVSRSFIKDKSSRNTAAFRNTVTRFSMKNTKSAMPGPGQYDMDTQGLKRGASQGRLSENCSAIFRQPSGAKRIKVNLYDPFESVENEDKLTPGPGQYTGEQETTFKRSLSGAKLCSSMFAPHEIIDRFGKPKTELKKGWRQMMPGPGEYYKEADKATVTAKYGAGFVFKSSVRRANFTRKMSGPGPAFYKVKSVIVKESKNINPKREWI
eukprot:TRINITY_DN4298_c0_g1_i4.p1 TRINITY_DN4298_c0_g1~~TRINITY_DN4298_c0_g1_i4.p1  ORF type:complete len:399 (-),score=55.55 TRINITY_DN4298_c0_g1_i4:103-1299(-)